MKSCILKAIAVIVALARAHLLADGNFNPAQNARAPLRPAPELDQQFWSPPHNAKPWVYWYFMDGNPFKKDPPLPPSGLLGQIKMVSQ